MLTNRWKAKIGAVVLLTLCIFATIKVQFTPMQVHRLSEGDAKPSIQNVPVTEASSSSPSAATTTTTIRSSTSTVQIVQPIVPKVLLPTLNDSYADVKARFSRRRAKVDQVCARNNPDFRETQMNNSRNGISMQRTMVSLDRHALMCYTLKAGSSSWNDVFWHLREPEVADKLPFFERAVFGNLGYYEKLTDKQRADLYTHPEALLMMSVRHPFARLISGWDDKFTKMYFYQRWFDQFPHMKDYPSLRNRWSGQGHFMSWESFAQYVADHGMNLRNLDDHFKPTSCNPCAFPFDIIVKAETFETSADWILKEKLRYDTMRSLNKARVRTKPEEKVREMFSKLERSTVEKLVQVYEKEMELFGYTFDVESLTAGGWED